jgi:hypothetical protein
MAHCSGTLIWLHGPSVSFTALSTAPLGRATGWEIIQLNNQPSGPSPRCASRNSNSDTDPGQPSAGYRARAVRSSRSRRWRGWPVCAADRRSQSREGVSLFPGRRNNSVVPTKPFSLAREETLKQSPGINILGSNNGVRSCGTSSSTCFTTSLARDTWLPRGSNGDLITCGLEERESLDRKLLLIFRPVDDLSGVLMLQPKQAGSTPHPKGSG